MNFIKNAALTTMIAVGVAFGAEAQTAKKTAKQPVKAKTETPAKAAVTKTEEKAPVVIPVADREITFGSGKKAFLDSRLKDLAQGFSMNVLATTEATNCVQIGGFSVTADGENQIYFTAEGYDKDGNGLVTKAELENIWVEEKCGIKPGRAGEEFTRTTVSSGLEAKPKPVAEEKKGLGKAFQKLGKLGAASEDFGSQVTQIFGVDKPIPSQYVKNHAQAAEMAFGIFLKPN